MLVEIYYIKGWSKQATDNPHDDKKLKFCEKLRKRTRHKRRCCVKEDTERLRE